MGNCLRGGDSQSDDYSLLNSQSDNISQQMGNTQAPRVPTSSSHPTNVARQETRQRSHDFNPAPLEDVVHVQAFAPEALEASSSKVDEMKMAQRFGLIQHLPSGLYDGGKKDRECPICMVELNAGDPVRFLPCMHVYHKDCIDDWLLKHSLTCPNCMEPVDSALLNSYEVGKAPWNFSS